MAADDAGERTEQPTSRRIQEAREAGRIPRSQDMGAAVSLLGGLMLLKVFGGGIFETMLNMTLSIGDDPDVTAAGLAALVRRIGLTAFYMLLPFLALLMVITAVGLVLQAGLPISIKRLKPSLEKLNPLKGIKRLFSLDSVTRVGMGLLKMVFIAAVAYMTIVAEINVVIAAGSIPPIGAFDLGSALLYKMALRMAIVLLILALLDYVYQRWNWWRKLKMTKQEVKDEMKNMEGDPKMRQRRRQAQLQLAMQRIGVQVPQADVVVSNPTEYAVALRYDEAAMAAPRVTAKGKDLLALRIRQIAQQHGVPIVQRPPLARAIYAAVEVGREVPPTFYRAVAEVLAYVYQLAGARN